MSIATLNRQQHSLAKSQKQLEILDDHDAIGIPSFQEKLETAGLFPLLPVGVDIFQVNVGKMCNQTCKHCHVDAGPDRREIMTRETMQQVLGALDKSDASTVDITGGAPEMNPDFRWLVEEVSSRGKNIMVRCNLTIILANPKYRDLPEFFKKHRVNVVSSLPYFAARRTNAQRGEGVFEKSIQALKMLNETGYGAPHTNLKLDLVYNPSGAFMPGDQLDLEMEFKQRLREHYNVQFNQLFAITNLPISRFLDYLINSENYEEYMNELANAFNPTAAVGVMCRNMISIGWDGSVYDCDFNQMLDLTLRGSQAHISNFDQQQLLRRDIKISQHCYGCTAGAGSSCGGATT